MATEALQRLIRDVPNFPKPGIVFKDITPLLADGAALRLAVESLAKPFEGSIDIVLGIESRGFILGACVALELGVGLALVRKPGKLPAATHAIEYALEYGTDSLEIHRDAIGHGARVLLVDDLLATGGTAQAAVQLVRRLGGDLVAASFLIELAFLNGRSRLDGVSVRAVLRYDD